MIPENLINLIYKKLQYACFFAVTRSDVDSTFFSEKNWECIIEKSDVSDINGILDKKYPTIFHYSWISKDYTESIINYIDISTNRPGWQKRFIVVGFEDICTAHDTKIKSLYYTKIESVSGNFYIHDLYKHYLNRK